MFVNQVKDRDTVCGECGMFAAKDQVKLLYTAEKVLKVYNPVTGKLWQENRDWIFDSSANSIVRLPESSIPAFTREMLAPEGENLRFFPAPDANAITGRVGGGNLIFDRKSFFAENQIEADYIAAGDQTFLADLAAPQNCRLHRFRSKLANRQAVRIIALGDSITVGNNSGKVIGFPPYRKPWLEQFFDRLEQKFAIKCHWENRAVNGSASDYPLNKPEVLAGAADLWIIAFGMNDLAHHSAEEFARNLRKIISQVAAADPAAGFMLLTPMSGHPDWKRTPLESTARFSEEIRKIAGDTENILLADVNKLWSKVLTVKDFYDLTGNGVNHPNDYGHTIYAAAVDALF